MNLLKKLTVGALALAMPSMAFATPTFIYLCGSTAYRAPVTIAVINYLGTTTCYAAGNSSSILKAQTGIFANGSVTYTGSTFTGSATVIVETNWTGSLSGVLDLAAQNPNLPFADPTDATNVEANMTLCTTSFATSPGHNFASGAGTGVLPYDVATNVPGYNTITTPPTACMSDSFASSAASVMNGAKILSGTIGGVTVAQGGPGLKNLINGAGLKEAGTAAPISGIGSATGYLGIVPFVWALGNTADTDPIPSTVAPTPFTNITQQTASFLTHFGYAPWTMFCTSSSNLGGSAPYSPADFVYLIGRNEDSGTRICGLAEPQPATGFAANPVQWLPTFSGAVNDTQDIPQPQLTATKAIGGASSNTSSTTTGFASGVTTFTISSANSSILIGDVVTDTTASNAAIGTVSDVNATTVTLTVPATNGASPSDSLKFTFAGDSIVNLAKWPAADTLNTETNISWSLSGHCGYPGGGDVSSVLSTPVDENVTYNSDGSVSGFPTEDGANAYFMGYLGLSDAEGTTGSSKVTGGTILSYNGVAESTQTIDNGSYSFWSYEHMYYSSASASIGQQTILNSLANSIAATYAPYDSSGVIADGVTSHGSPAVIYYDGAGVLLEANGGGTATANGNVSRTVEGGQYSLNY